MIRPGRHLDRRGPRAAFFHYSGRMLSAVAMGARVRALRRARGLTLEGLAAASGVSRSMISEIERGGRAPTVLVLDRIATALGSSIARLTQDESRYEPVLLARDDPA